MRHAITALTLAASLAVGSLFPDATAQAQEASGLAQSTPALTDMSAEDREKLRIEIRAYLLEHPELLSEVIAVLQARQKADRDKADADKIAKYSDLIFQDGISWVGGNPDGDVTVVEFADYRCGYCKKAFPEIKQLLEDDPNLRFVIKEFPILGPDSVAAAKMALAALKIDRDRYGDLHDALYQFGGPITEEVAYKVAGQQGYDVEALKAEAESDAIKAMVNANYALAQELELEGTPSFVIGKEIVRGYMPLEQMKAAVAEARAAVN